MQQNEIPGYRLNEYLLVISPNEALWDRIMDEKKKFAESYQSTTALRSKPHITLINFVAWNMMEEKIATRFRHIAMGVTPFKIELKDFGSYPSHTIYINVATKIPIQELGKKLKQVQRLMKAHPDYNPHFINDPHLTIARKLKPWQYEKGWLEYSHKHFSAKIIADSMLMLKRPLGGEKAYQIVERFEFLNMPVATKQGELFV
ncbi:MAG: 2'-5' RNA ligase family protein [Chitinophagaceae bacterium]|nr:2'-5' RNA ligase family protein [Chitinophagaceae bacterium]